MRIIIAILLLIMGNIASANTKILRFATEASYPPFEYVNQKGELKGFDIEIAKAICTELKAQCEFSNQSFNSLIPSLTLGKFDAVIAAIGVTVERQKQVDFSKAYYEPSASFVGAKNKKFKFNELDGYHIGVQQGSTFEKYLRDNYADTIHIKSYASIQDAFLDLIAERIELVLTDTPIANDWLAKFGNDQLYQVINKAIVNKNYFGAGFAIAIKKNNAETLNAINLAITKLKQNGTYQAIYDKFFGQNKVDIDP